ncbi:MAG TPA: hypothetical protein VLI05_01865 [Candidatus Saccharimonadia bacterium]|nr:hypothetical protein [Candidatus Saccharimonadia bacterium]
MSKPTPKSGLDLNDLKVLVVSVVPGLILGANDEAVDGFPQAGPGLAAKCAIEVYGKLIDWEAVRRGIEAAASRVLQDAPHPSAELDAARQLDEMLVAIEEEAHDSDDVQIVEGQPQLLNLAATYRGALEVYLMCCGFAAMRELRELQAQTARGGL